MMSRRIGTRFSVKETPIDCVSRLGQGWPGISGTPRVRRSKTTLGSVKADSKPHPLEETLDAV